jgi:CheY-like chemotaxis protein
MVATVQDQPQGCGAILVCDDDLAVLQFVCQALQVKGFQVFPAPNGPEAVAMLAKNNSIRLLILDYTMPEMNGAAVIKELRKTHPDLPVLLMTGHADPEAIQDNLPGVAVLRKPFDDEGLHRRVAGMLEAARGGVDHPVA